MSQGSFCILKLFWFLDDLVYPHSDTYDLDFTAEQSAKVKIFKNNKNQTDVIRCALRDRFTLIQGPPGESRLLISKWVTLFCLLLDKSQINFILKQ